MAFKKAKREQVWTKTLLVGASGSGKSYSALRMATGLAEKCNSDIAVIDTEAGRIKYYANEFNFDLVTLNDYQPETYTEYIEEAINSGYKVIIIDSISHEWDYCLELNSKLGGRYTDWKNITPRHEKFRDKILQSPAHIICTARGKDEYILEERNGKQVPKKVGLGYKQRTDTEYEYTVAFNIAQDTHIASATKDNTHIFEGKYDILTEQSGKALYEWANTGEKVESKNNTASVSVDDIIKQIGVKAQELITNGIEKTDISQTIKSIAGSANYKKITNIDIAQNVLEALDNIGGDN